MSPHHSLTGYKPNKFSLEHLLLLDKTDKVLIYKYIYKYFFFIIAFRQIQNKQWRFILAYNKWTAAAPSLSQELVVRCGTAGAQGTRPPQPSPSGLHSSSTPLWPPGGHNPTDQWFRPWPHLTERQTDNLTIAVPPQTSKTRGPGADPGSRHEAWRGGQGEATCLLVADWLKLAPERNSPKCCCFSWLNASGICFPIQTQKTCKSRTNNVKL